MERYFIRENMSNIKDISAVDFVSDVVETSNNVPIIVDFWAPWCQPCKQLTPLLETAVSKFDNKVMLAKINIDENQEIAAQLRVQSIPTVYTFYQGKVVDGFQGVKTSSEILEYVKKSASLSGPGEDIENLVSKAKIAIENKYWDELGDIAKDILSSDSKNELGYSFLIKSLVGLNRFSEAKQVEENLETDIKSSKPVSEVLLTIEISEKAFKAKENLESLKIKLKNDPDNLDYMLETAIALFGNGEIEGSFNLLLKSIQIDKDWRDQSARKQLLEFFTSLGFDAKETINARRKLATLLF